MVFSPLQFFASWLFPSPSSGGTPPGTPALGTGSIRIGPLQFLAGWLFPSPASTGGFVSLPIVTKVPTSYVLVSRTRDGVIVPPVL